MAPADGPGGPGWRGGGAGMRPQSSSRCWAPVGPLDPNAGDKLIGEGGTLVQGLKRVLWTPACSGELQLFVVEMIYYFSP